MSPEEKPLKVQVLCKGRDGGDHTRLYSPSSLRLVTIHSWSQTTFSHQI